MVRFLKLALLRALQGFASLAFPSQCLLCRETLAKPLDGPACPSCLDRLPTLSGPSCPRCGLAYEPTVAPGLCGPCRSGRFFRRARALYPFDEPVRECVHALKYGGRRRLGSIFGWRAGGRWLASRPEDVTAVVSIPLSPGRRRARGYNQAEIIARAVARRTGLPFIPRALQRVGERPPQAGLSARERRRNVAGAFRARRASRLSGETVLLVDDVYTTGATIESAARALLRAGVSAVEVLTLVRVGEPSLTDRNSLSRMNVRPTGHTETIAK